MSMYDTKFWNKTQHECNITNTKYRALVNFVYNISPAQSIVAMQITHTLGA